MNIILWNKLNKYNTQYIISWLYEQVKYEKVSLSSNKIYKNTVPIFINAEQNVSQEYTNFTLA